MTTSPQMIHLLFVEDSEDDLLLILRELRRAGFEITASRVETESALLAALSQKHWDVVISDFNMPHLTGLRALQVVRRVRKDLPFILVSGSIGEQLAVQAMKAGAQDYIMKNNLARLASAVRRELAEAGERGKRREMEAELEEKERQLVTAQRMEAVGRLAGGIAHDLNNMIGACTLYAEIALEPDQAIATIRDSIQEIVKAQERATRLVKQLLAFSRRQVVDPQVISVNQVIADVQKMLSQILGEDVELIMELDSALKPVLADPTQIDQVIMNLVVNARDAMPKGGTLSIKTQNETVGPDHWLLKPGSDCVPGDYARLTVTDTGTGIEEKVMARIFEPFFTTKELGKGTGLGLSTVFGIVKQAGGEVRVRSELGRGTSFDIFFKAVEAFESQTPLAADLLTERNPTVGRTLLLVEDDASIRRALERSLAGLGHKLHVAVDGEDGIRLFEQHHQEIDLLVSDVVMPKISGPDMVKLMWAKKPDLKVLFLSGYSHEVLASHGVDHKATFLLPKPFTIRQFTQKVVEILESR